MIRIERGDGGKYAETSFQVFANDALLMVVGFQRMALIGSDVYITLTPTEYIQNVPHSVWRELRTKFAAIGQYNLCCQIPASDTTAQRFAEFFGLKPCGNILNRIHYEKEAA